MIIVQLCSRRLCLRTMASTATAKVLKVRSQSLNGEDKLDLIFNDRWGGHHELQRSKEEQVSNSLKRIELTLVKHARKRNTKKRKSDDVASLSLQARLYTPTGILVEGDVPNKTAWAKERVLEVGLDRYVVQVDPPNVLTLTLPKSFIMTGCPVVPEEVELEHSQIHLCKWRWFRHPLPDANHTTVSSPSLTVSVPDHTQQVLSTNYTYWPSEEDAGHQLLLECTPVSPNGDTGVPVTALSLAVVSQSPRDTPIIRRHLQTPWQLAEPDLFRMVTYNTLASTFTSDSYAREVLYPYCDPNALCTEYRQGRLVQEVIGYNADVINLQEVKTSEFGKFFLPVFKDKGYDGFHQQKSGNVNEGEAIFFNTSKFNLVDSQSVRISDFLRSDPSCSQLYQGLQKAPYFVQDVIKRNSIVLVGLLQSVECPDRYLMVANTHFYYHPKGDHIRLVQAATMLNYLQTRLDCYSASLGNEARVATVIGGDFNSCSCIAAYQYLVTGAVDKDHKDWMIYKSKEIPRCSCYYKYNVKEGGEKADNTTSSGEIFPPHIQLKLDREEMALQASQLDSSDFIGLDLRHDLHFHNATGTENLTNYTASFKAVLDYILVDLDELAVDRVIPLPSLEEVSEFVALPSVHFPSDHLALIADLKWK